jgi:hypothetical protein
MAATPHVIAQQYSSATFVLLRFHLRKENAGVRFKSVISSLFFLPHV